VDDQIAGVKRQIAAGDYSQLAKLAILQCRWSLGIATHTSCHGGSRRQRGKAEDIKDESEVARIGFPNPKHYISFIEEVARRQRMHFLQGKHKSLNFSVYHQRVDPVKDTDYCYQRVFVEFDHRDLPAVTQFFIKDI